MYAIETVYKGPTDASGGRIVARTTDKRPSTGRADRIVVWWDHSLDVVPNHDRAARTSCRS